MGSGGINWLPDGKSFTSVEKYSIVKTELPSMIKTVLFAFDQLIPKDKSHPLTISSFTIPNNMKQVLLKMNTKTQDHKTTGEVWVYDSAAGNFKRPASLQSTLTGRLQPNQDTIRSITT